MNANIERFRDIYRSLTGEELLVKLAKIKVEGASALEAVQVLIYEDGLSLSEADQFILDSRIWNTDDSTKVRIAFWNMLEKVSKEERGG
ncbi:MAG: hypothetical protein AAFN81_00890 [Bacteroidota bacterium]